MSGADKRRGAGITYTMIFLLAALTLDGGGLSAQAALITVAGTLTMSGSMVKLQNNVNTSTLNPRINA
ncbi:hypothetical protein AGMMS49942_26400 [Spirochaetia bacterium]|nr:hypothetical protein AGMMS49942_26400 [Spirochaetia bacterium]